MSTCPCDKPRDVGLESLPAGLSSLPRQLSTFAQTRRDLLARIRLPDKTALLDWRARDPQDLGLMWMEMWAYIADVLGFYDERIANESYLRTAVRRPSLRRIIDLVGHTPAPGVGGSVTLAAIAEGKGYVSLPVGTGFRSSAFGDHPPQVYETDIRWRIHPTKNLWELGPQPTPTVLSASDELTFKTRNFGLSRDQIVLFHVKSEDKYFATQVVDVDDFEGVDGG